MQELVEQIKRIAAGVMNTRAHGRWGFVQSVDPDGPLVRLEYQPEGVLSGWLPVLQAGAGQGATDGVIPQPGWLAFVAPDQGEAEHGVVLGFAHFNDAPMPPVQNDIGAGGTQSGNTAPAVGGERIIRAFGSVIRLCENGDVVIRPGSGKLRVDGSIEANGEVSDRRGSLQRLRHNYNLHTNPSNGNDTPTTPDPEI